MDRWSEVPGRHGRLRREREVLASKAERHHAVQGRIRGGRFPEEPRSPRAEGYRISRRQLHQGARVAHTDEEERAQRLAGLESVR